MSDLFLASLDLEDLEVTKKGFRAHARFTPQEHDGRIDVLGAGAFTKTLLDAGDRLTVTLRVGEGVEEVPAIIEPDGLGLVLEVRCSPERAKLFDSAVLHIAGIVERERVFPAARQETREIQALKLQRLEITRGDPSRPGTSLNELELDYQKRIDSISQEVLENVSPKVHNDAGEH